MIEARRLRRLVISVALLSGLFVVLSRRVGRLEPPSVATRAPEEAAAAPSRTPGAPGTEADAIGDLTFFQGLGKPRAGSSEAAPVMPRAAGERDPNGNVPEASAWVVQAMATTDVAAARRLRERLGRAGLPASILEDRQPKRVAYRVRVGRYRDRPGAEAMAKRLRDDFGLNPWILPEGD